MSTRSEASSNGGGGGDGNFDEQSNAGNIDDEEQSNDGENNLDFYENELNKFAKRRQHRKALDIKNNGLSTDGLQIMLDRYDTNVRFIESIQTGTSDDRALIVEMRGQTASQIYTRCSKRDSFTETHVGDDIMATFSTIRDYRAACDMQRMDADRFQQVFDRFAAWDESQYEEFKRNYTLEYVFRRILQRDARYRSRYTRLLKQCQEANDYSSIDRPLLPLPTPKFLTGDSQLELCNSSLRSKLRNMRTRTPRGGQIETSPESEAFLARLDEAVSSFFRRLDFVEDANWRMSTPASSASTVLATIKKESTNNNETTTTGTKSKKEGNRKRPASLSLRGLIGGDAKRPTTTMVPPRPSAANNSKAAAKVNTLARAFLRKAFRAPIRTNHASKSTNGVKKEIAAGEIASTSTFPADFADQQSSKDETIIDSQIAKETSTTPAADAVEESNSKYGNNRHHQKRPSLLSSKRPSSYITKSRKSINNIGIEMMLKNGQSAEEIESLSKSIDFDRVDQADNRLLEMDDIDSNGFYQDQLSDGSLFGVGADEPIDEEDLRSILNDLSGMHAVINCDDFGRVIEHGSIQHSYWGTILVRRNRVVRLGSAQTGFQAPDPRMEFHLPMEQLPDYVPWEKIRFDDERNLYLNGILTDFYFLQP